MPTPSPQESQILYESMKDSVNPVILDGLKGIGYDRPGGLSEEHVHFSPTGSNVFNALTRAYYLLRKHPNIELSEEPIRVGVDLSTLGGYLLNAVNASISRDQKEPISFSSGPSLVIDVLACPDAEENFFIATGVENKGRYDVFPEYRRQKNIIFNGEDNQPVIYKKAYGETSALGLKPLSVNGISYPAGMLYWTEEYDDLKEMSEKHEKNLLLTKIEQIRKILPLRLTRYALPPKEQAEALTRYGCSPSMLAHCGQSNTFSLDELMQRIPGSNNYKAGKSRHSKQPLEKLSAEPSLAYNA